MRERERERERKEREEREFCSPLLEEKVTVSTMPAPLAFGAAVTVRDSDAWKTGSCRRALPMSASDVAVVKRADKKKLD